MIVKEKEFKKEQTGYYQKLGDKAEKQMAFYLKRHFGDEDSYFVFNDLKIEHNGEKCQIDHLVLSLGGIFIIESKSCVGEISYDQYDQWIRNTKKGRFGMQSPIEQSELQKKILKNYLTDNNQDGALLGKMIGITEKFGARRFDNFVAISDTTIIEHPKKVNPFVLKADKVCDQIKELSTKQKSMFSTITTKYVGFTQIQIENIKDFLLTCKANVTKDVEKSKETEEEKKSEEKPNEKDLDCNHQDEILYGKYGYYFKCKQCERSKNINEKCQCGKKMKIKKDKKDFYIRCENCNQEKLYFSNK